MGKIIRGLFRENPFPSEKTAAIIPCGGKGTRMKIDFNKIFLAIEDKPVISYTLDVFENCPLISEVIIPAAENDIQLLNDVISDFGYKKVKAIVRGGKTRQESIENALKSVSSDIDFVAVHDGARPLLSETVLSKTVETAIRFGAAATGIMAKDTLKTVKNGKLIATVDRSSTALIQTPQVFRKDILVEAYKNARENGIEVTDDTSLFENTDIEIAFVEGSPENIKLTTPDDYFIINSIIRSDLD